MKFKYFDHTADIMFEAYGKTLEETFCNAGLAMFNILTDIRKVKAVKSFSIKVAADKLEKLIFDFLDELLFLLDTEHLLVSKFNDMKVVKKNDNYELTCAVLGDQASNYDTHGDIKAPTYNEMKITQNNNDFIFRIVVDI